jgi:succinate dehydrogenase/fumarate reductase flavoprotein subunit
VNAATNSDYDVIVLGGGGSGLAAAIEARSLGRKVVVVEKGKNVGGTTAWSIGSISATNTPHQLAKGIKDSPDDHFEDFAKFNAKLGAPDNLALRRLLVDNVSDSVRWLMEMGVEFFGPLPELPHRQPRMHNVLPNSKAYIYHLKKRALKLGVEIRTSTAAKEFVLQDGKVIGVDCAGPSGPVRLTARGGVVMASGDYAGSSKLRSEYIRPELAAFHPVNPENTGDGHMMALKLGGRIINRHLHHSGVRFVPPQRPHWLSKVPPWRFITRSMNIMMDRLPAAVLRRLIMSFLTTIMIPSKKLYEAGAILINKDGERFCNELHEPGYALSQQPNGQGYVLLDSRIAKKFCQYPYYVSTAPGVAYAFIDDYKRNRPELVFEADSLEKLAAMLKIDPAQLQATVKLHLDNVGPELKLDTPPYIAMGPVQSYINFTDGGVAIDDQLRVLGAGDQVIEGLYAAGNAGMGGVLLEGHGHHLGWAFTSGRLAGRAAALRCVSPPLDAGSVAGS